MRNRIPNGAKCVFSGVFFDAYQWSQAMYDGTHDIFESIGREDTTEVIAVAGDRIYYCEQEQPWNDRPLLSLFGGRIDDTAEISEEAARRGLREESGMVSDDWESFHTYRPLSKMDWHIHVFIAREVRIMDARGSDSYEHVRVRDTDFDTFIDMVCARRFRVIPEFICDILRLRLTGRTDDLYERLFHKKRTARPLLPPFTLGSETLDHTHVPRIPAHATRVFSGVRCDVYQWEITDSSGKIRSFERASRETGTDIIATSHGRILYCEQEQPDRGAFLSLIGGGQEDGETIDETLRRELREEAGMVSDDWESFAIYHTLGNADHDCHMYIARDAYVVGAQELDAGERITIRDLDFDTFIAWICEGRFRVHADFVCDILRFRLAGTLDTFRDRLFPTR